MMFKEKVKECERVIERYANLRSSYQYAEHIIPESFPLVSARVCDWHEWPEVWVTGLASGPDDAMRVLNSINCEVEKCFLHSEKGVYISGELEIRPIYWKSQENPHYTYNLRVNRHLTVSMKYEGPVFDSGKYVSISQPEGLRFYRHPWTLIVWENK